MPAPQSSYSIYIKYQYEKVPDSRVSITGSDGTTTTASAETVGTFVEHTLNKFD